MAVGRPPKHGPLILIVGTRTRRVPPDLLRVNNAFDLEPRHVGVRLRRFTPLITHHILRPCATKTSDRCVTTRRSRSYHSSLGETNDS